MKFASKWKCVCMVMLAVLFFVIGISFAQEQGGQPPSPPSANDIVTRMKQELNLTDEQVSQIISVIQDENNQMQSLMGQGADRDAARSQMDTIRQNTESKLAQYLTPDQLAQWKNKQQSSSQQRMSSGDSNSDMGPGPGGPPGK